MCDRYEVLIQSFLLPRFSHPLIPICTLTLLFTPTFVLSHFDHLSHVSCYTLTSFALVPGENEVSL